MEEGKTTVVNIKTGAEYDVYIGRANGRYKLPASDWGNPFRVGRDATERELQECLDKYRAHIRFRPDLLIRLGELKGKRLGCWCAPLLCHGDVLIELMTEQEGK